MEQSTGARARAPVDGSCLYAVSQVLYTEIMECLHCQYIHGGEYGKLALPGVTLISLSSITHEIVALLLSLCLSRPGLSMRT